MDIIFEPNINLPIYSDQPNWFDYFSLFITVLSIVGAYLTARYFYRREKKDSDLEKNNIQTAEIDLFDINISNLKKSLKLQIIAIDEYIEKQDFSLSFSTNINVDFLNYIDIKTLYKIKNIKEKTEIRTINDLLAKLFFLRDFQNLLRNEVQIYIKRYNEIETRFYEYDKVLYSDYFKLVNKRLENINRVEEKKIIQFSKDDKFIQDYVKLRDEIFKNEDVIKNGELISRENFNELYILELIHICEKYIPEDFDAINISAIANSVNRAFDNLDIITKKHFIVVKSYRDLLETIIEKVDNYSK